MALVQNSYDKHVNYFVHLTIWVAVAVNSEERVAIVSIDRAAQAGTNRR
jgi:hypothetical protein